MTIRPPRRIFRPSRTLRIPRPGPVTVLAIACVLAGAAGLAALPPRLFGRAPETAARVDAGPADVAVVDGETLRVKGVVVHLAGVSAPARGDQCRPGVDCGNAASRGLASLVRDRPVRCDLQDSSGGRPVGACYAGADDLSRALVAQGWARAERADLREPEQQARDARRGLWAGTP